MKDVECPHCGYGINICNYEGEESWIEECSECEKEFKVYAEPTVYYSSAKIEYGECPICKREFDTDDLHGWYPRPKAFEHLKRPEDRVCDSCYNQALAED